MRPIILLLTLAFPIPFFSAKETPSSPQTSGVSPAAVIREINLVRQNLAFTQRS
jgi:hypothetical protein